MNFINDRDTSLGLCNTRLKLLAEASSMNLDLRVVSVANHFVRVGDIDHRFQTTYRATSLVLFVCKCPAITFIVMLELVEEAVVLSLNLLNLCCLRCIAHCCILQSRLFVLFQGPLPSAFGQVGHDD
jgi:hypothetical protein